MNMKAEQENNFSKIFQKPELLTRQEAAEYLGITSRTLAGVHSHFVGNFSFF